ncbi:hypothetical protein IKG28_02430 [Candidatus Saccharibacteria bacterium]|nr:hypothetical protein [Candidatus Saccharibacteria bacterium]MBR3332462.1 hypothetical protein [Candidatus Saccharibacteria bacterium]
MVCIAAFIILALIGGVVAIVSIFKPKVGKSYWKMFKKAWGCLWKKVRLQKCETGFKDDVKNTLLSRVIVKHPKWVKPLSVIIEILSVVIVIIAVWAILTAIKSLLALWALGSCNVTKPSACSLGAEVCSIDESEPQNPIEATGRWFTEWGEIFEAIPDKFKTYKAEDYNFNYINIDEEASDEKPIAVDIFDPGCSVCMISYRNQKASGFFDKYNTRLVPFAIQDTDGNYKFKNSDIIVRYMFAVEQLYSGRAIKLLDHIFTEKNEDGVSYQNLFNDEYSRDDAIKQLEKWLNQDGLNEGEIKEVRVVAGYPEIVDKMSENKNIVENELRVKGIPTMIYDGGRHTGLYKAE